MFGLLVEAGSNTCTVTLRGEGSDEEENPVPEGLAGSPCSRAIEIRRLRPQGWRSIESETVKYAGVGPENDSAGEDQLQLQTLHLFRHGASYQQTHNCQKVIQVWL
jgi:hypothetical protein